MSQNKKGSKFSKIIYYIPFKFHKFLSTHNKGKASAQQGKYILAEIQYMV